MSWNAAHLEVLQTYEVEVQLLSGGPQAAYGMLFCVQDPESYYAVLIDTQGCYSVETSADGSKSAWPWEASEHLRIGVGSTNLLRVDFEPFDCTFTVSFNGTVVAMIQDAALTGGCAGYPVRVPEDENPARNPIDARFASTGNAADEPGGAGSLARGGRGPGHQ